MGLHKMERYTGCGLEGGVETAWAGHWGTGWGIRERGVGVLGAVL